MTGDKPEIIFYMHAGSGNHGCEAIVNSMCVMLKQLELPKVMLLSNDASEDQNYSLKGLCRILQEKKFDNHLMAHVLYYIYRKLTGDRESFIRYRYKEAFQQKKAPLAISIGGDNYCYDVMLSDLRLANSAFNKAGKKTVLLGCSIEPELLENRNILEDLQKYHTIIARESITYEALVKALEQSELMDTPRICMYPDPAFTLEKTPTTLPQGFIKGKTIGVNLSPLIQESEEKPGITMESYQALLQYLLDNTGEQIALIPHVVWKRNDDRLPLLALYEKYKHTGRVILVEDRSCTELKSIIADCSLFIGARTHATIAAYSSLVPTLVVGYSVKARGIARDLFGTEEHYVLPVQSLQNSQDLIEACKWLIENKNEIKEHLTAVMPDYTKKALGTGKEVENLWEELNQQPGI